MKLCKGFSLTRIDHDKQEILEVLYALLDDGTVLKTNEHKKINQFNTIKRRWYVAEGLPNDAEFIGNYAVPSTRI